MAIISDLRIIVQMASTHKLHLLSISSQRLTLEATSKEITV